MGSLKALKEWCRITCENYPNVEIRNMSTSFRDGLAFCAIIHKHRPDLIDFSTLSKDNIYENNNLVFKVAESKLSIPALLEARDMVSTEVPDQLGIITYLSSYYNCFTKTCQGIQASLKKSSVTERSRKPSKSCRSNRGTPCSVCASCSKPVHLVQRHLAEGKLYHRTCFRCSMCSSTLLPGSYKEGSDRSSLVCSHHQAACQTLDSDDSKLTGSTENSGLFDVTGETESGDTVICKKGGAEKEGERKTRPDTSEKTRPLCPPKSCVEEAVTQPVQTNQTKSPDLILKYSSDLASVSPGLPVAAHRCELDSTSSAPKTHPPKATESPSVSGNAVCIKSLPSPSPRFGQSAGHCKLKNPHWLELVQPGPWAKLPPAPPPSMAKPPRSGSRHSIRGNWYREKVPPPNPFEEFEDNREVTNEKEAGEEETLRSTINQAQPSMVTSQTWCGTSQLVEAANLYTQAYLEDTSRDVEKSHIDGEDDTVNMPEIVDVPKVGLAKEECSLSVFNVAHVGGIAKAGGTVDACHFANIGVGALTKMSEAAWSLGLHNLTETKTRSASDLSSGSSVDVSNLDEAARSLGLSDPVGAASQGGLVGVISLPTICHLNEEASCYGVTEASARSLHGSDLAGADDIGSVTGAPSVLSKSDIAHHLPLPKSASMPAISPSVSLSCTKGHTPPTWSTNGAAASPSLHQPPSLSSVSEVSDSGQPPVLSHSKVPTDYVQEVELQEEMAELEKQMCTLEKRGVEMERRLRDFQNDEEEEDMWVDWFNLIHEKHMLLRRDAELVYMAKQQHLEARQADVEYNLRCLLNKPETEWSHDNFRREEQLMKQLVDIIEQRNHIITNLDQDRKREKDEMLLAATIKTKDFHKDTGKYLKKFRAKFKHMKVLKMLSPKDSKSKDF
ncbi:hypothetical protein UPYG_G00101590 [Umbra pygmaea]|uniref:MICAL-like protein 1 n=1 Tax=Umbra pygmaea TaxID=75934 RepID=A0ABD0XQJ7_UMBPY